MELARAAEEVQRFESGALTARISGAEQTLEGLRAEQLPATLVELGVGESLLSAATVLKRAVGQVNVLIHAVGILTSLPKELTQNKLSCSLDAWRTRKGFAHAT